MANSRLLARRQARTWPLPCHMRQSDVELRAEHGNPPRRNLTRSLHRRGRKGATTKRCRRTHGRSIGRSGLGRTQRGPPEQCHPNELQRQSDCEPRGGPPAYALAGAGGVEVSRKHLGQADAHRGLPIIEGRPHERPDSSRGEDGNQQDTRRNHDTAGDAWPIIQWPSRTRAPPRRTRVDRRALAVRRIRSCSAKRTATCIRSCAIRRAINSWRSIRVTSPLARCSLRRGPLAPA